MIGFLEYYQDKGHVFGECMSHCTSEHMYINIPKNASSWTRSKLQEHGWEIYNYHTDNLYHKHALIVLRDPVERWLSGIAEYMYLYHRSVDSAYFSKCLFDLIFERVAFDDHTEKQILFLEKLDLDNCTFFKCDQTYRTYLSNFLAEHGIPNQYSTSEYQHVTASSPDRVKFKNIFTQVVYNNSKYYNKLVQYFKQDFELFDSIKFYDAR